MVVLGDGRSAQAIIDQAIRENKGGERLLYCLSGGTCTVGLFMLIWGGFNGQPVIALAGSIPTSMLWPAIHFARRMRQENQALRLLEFPLSRAATATAAAEMLRDVFLKVFLAQDPAPTTIGTTSGGGHA